MQFFYSTSVTINSFTFGVWWDYNEKCRCVRSQSRCLL